MASRTKDMSTGKPAALIISFALPLMLGNVFQQLYTIVDTAIVGKALGVNALAALGAVDWLNWLVLGMIQGITQGFAILMAREFGAKEYEKLQNSVESAARRGYVDQVIAAADTRKYLIGAFEMLYTKREDRPAKKHGTV